MSNLGLAKLITEEVFSELDGRSGFDHWWGGIEKDVADEILDELTDRVKKTLDTVRGSG